MSKIKSEKLKPFFSIIIPAFNREKYIDKAIESVLKQKFRDFEVIVINDASTDNTGKIIKNYKDNRIVYLQNSKNIERSSSRNKGIDISRGEYICFLDSDDYYLPNHLMCLKNKINNSKNKIAMFAASCIKETPLSKKNIILKRDPEYSRVEQVIRYNIPCISVAIHYQILEKHRFNESLFINEDVELFARIAVDYPVYYFKETTAVWKIHNLNTKNQTADYISPQIYAFKIIFSNKKIANKVSKNFKNRMFSEKYAQLSSLSLEKKKYFKSTYYAIISMQKKFSKLGVSAFGAILYKIPIIGDKIKKLNLKMKFIKFNCEAN